MSRTVTKPRVFVLGNPDKPEVRAGIEDLSAFVADRAELVGSQLGLDAGHAIRAQPDYGVVLGGDGTLISVARDVCEAGIPLIGVNFGKLGFLTPFSVKQFRDCFDTIVTRKDLVSARTLLRVDIRRNGQRRFGGVCVNDCVIHAGPPFRLITISIELDGRKLTTVAGDGLIVCTPTGSTAHNLSAGGPLLMSDVQSIVLTPVSAHSLTHRPVVINADGKLLIQPERINPGTTAIMDGQMQCPLEARDRIMIRQHERRALLVQNPKRPKWYNLTTKLRWGRPPQR